MADMKDMDELRLLEMRRAVEKIVATFRQDEAQGYRSKDRQFVIELLGEFVDTGSDWTEKEYDDIEKREQAWSDEIDRRTDAEGK